MQDVEHPPQIDPDTEEAVPEYRLKDKAAGKNVKVTEKEKEDAGEASSTLSIGKGDE